MSIKKLLINLIAGLIFIAVFISIGYVCGLYNAPKPEKPDVDVKIDTVYIPNPTPDTVWLDREKPVYLKTVKVDTVCMHHYHTDSVLVYVPISHYVAHKDSLYHIEATGYDVEFQSITVYPKTVIQPQYIERKNNNHWGIGIQAGCGLTMDGNIVKLSPTLTVGISYNFITW